MMMMLSLKSLPKEPGVYLFKDRENVIVYVGKAKSLKSRVSSYFNKSDHSPRIQLLIKNISNVEFIVVNNEIEALLLENKLIKQHSPKYNISLRDSKTYAYLHITDEPFPRLLTTRKVQKRGELFGPYVDGSARYELQQLANKLFKLRICKRLPKKECLNYHIGLCTAPCIKNVSKEEYAHQIMGARKLLKGDCREIKQKLEQKMRSLSSQMRYEQALEIKRQLEALDYVQFKQTVDRVESYDQDVLVMQKTADKAIFELFSIKRGVIRGKKEYRFDFQEDIFESFVKLYYSQNPIPREIITNCVVDPGIVFYLQKLRQGNVTIILPERGDKRRLVEMALKNIQSEDQRLVELKEKLLLPNLPRIIECFDISNLGNDIIVAGMVRFLDGKPDRNNYRKFEMRSVKEQDDFASMKEVVHRRYHRLHEENLQMPNLIIIDGGLGQLNAALDALKMIGLQIPIIALAKEEEEVYLPNTEIPLQFDKNSAMMLLLRQIRDSVHRFALSYNKQKRRIKE